MDYSTIATTALAALSPIVVKGLDKLAEKTAEEGFSEREAIWEKVKALFKTDDLTLLNLLQDSEIDVKSLGKLEGKLETHLESNPEVAKELEVLFAKMPLSEVNLNRITQIGDRNTAFQDVYGSKININKK